MTKLSMSEEEMLKRKYTRPYEERIVDLEKENAELKEKLNFSTQYYQGEKAKEQLTKAKEIIKDLLGSENTSCEEEMFFEIRQKAEQFLSEVEK